MEKDILLKESYDYTLPEELIATAPAEPRDSSRLLVYNRATDLVIHERFSEIQTHIPKDAALIFNNTKVIKARIFGKKESGGEIELLLHRPLTNGRYRVQIRGKVKPGTQLFFDQNLCAEVVELNEDGSRIVTFSIQGKIPTFLELTEILQQIGHIPLPPYIKREDTDKDSQTYQSVFAKEEGAVAAPTASLHFTPKLFDSITQNHKFGYVTLHVGGGTFIPVEAENILDHPMHSEWYSIPDATRQLIDSDTSLLCVGTTSTRTVEYYVRTKVPEGECNLFLHPQNPPIRTQYLLTNFHLPKSTLIMLVAGFIGLEKTLELYEEAIKNRYRFYSYGDAMLIV